ncbi:MAG: LptA/OstA family protein [Thermodesulfobacteriota bacterium]
MRIRPLLLALCLMAAAILPAQAAEPVADMSKTPTKIESDSMRYDQAAGTVVFEGKVRVQRPDFALWSSSLTVHFAPQAGAKAEGTPTDAGRIEKIVARGAVRIERDGKVGACETATYLVQEGLFSMEGDPVLKDGANTVTGKVVKLYFKDNRSEVLGGEGQRVQATFSTPKGVGQ